MNLTRGINLHKIAELMPGASGAEAKVLLLSCDSHVTYSYIGCVYRSRYVCIERKACACDSRGL